MRYKLFTLSLSAALLLVTISCKAFQQQKTVEQIVSNTEDFFAPDSRVALFDVEVHHRDNLVLSGETNLPEAKAALLDSLSKYGITAVDKLQILPSNELSGLTYAVVKNSVSNMRSEPSHPSQLATQATLGMPLKVLKKQSNWYLVQTPDDYLSWMDSGGLQLMDKETFDEWKASDKLIYLDTYGYVFEEPSTSSPKVSDLVSGSLLRITDTGDNFYAVTYPDGRSGYVRRSEAQPFDQWKNTVSASEDKLVEIANTMRGVPYLWGGTSTKGVDCSGFTKTVYFMNGWIIPRDASQQVRAGESVDTSEGFENLRPGDLLFFGRPATGSSPQRVVHVGMWIGNNEFIHSPERPGHVTISSVDPESENYDEYNLNRYLETKRYLNHKKGNIISIDQMYAF